MPLAIILTAFGSLALLLKLANIQDRIRLNERLNHQRALAEMEYGDVVALPVAARNSAGGRRKIRSDRLAHDPMSLTHRGSGV